MPRNEIQSPFGASWHANKFLACDSKLEISKIPKISKFPGFTWSFHLNLEFSNFEIFRKNRFYFVQKHIRKITVFKIKIYFSRLLILNWCVSNLQVPTTSGAPWGKANVSEFMDFGEIRAPYKKKEHCTLIKKNNCYISGFYIISRWMTDLII